MNQIEKDLDELVLENLVSEEQSVAIKKYYAQKERVIKTSLIIPLIGVLLIGFGIIALAAVNWNTLYGWAKLTLAVTPLVLLLIAVFLKRDSKSNVLIECLSFGIGFATLFAFGIVFQYFQTPISLKTIQIIAGLSIIPVVYVLNAYWLGVIAYLLIFSAYVETLNIFIGLLLILMFPYYLMRIKRGYDSKVFTFLNVFLMFFIMRKIAYDYTHCLFITILCLQLISIFFKDHFYKSVVNTISYMIIIILSYVGARMLIDGLDFGFRDFIGIRATIDILISIPITILNIVFTKKKMESKIDLANGYVISTVSFAAMFLVLDNFFINIVVGIIIFILPTYLICLNIFESFKARNITKYNQFAFLFSSYVIIHILMLEELPYEFKGFLFVVVGIFFLVANVYILKSMKRGDEDGQQ